MRAVALALVAARLREPPAVRTGVPAEVLPRATPNEWQECSRACPLLDSVPHECMRNRGAMRVAPACFGFTCELATCLEGTGACAGVQAELWDKVEQAGQAVSAFLAECSRGTFTCLAACPDLRALLVDTVAIERCEGDREEQERCQAWLTRMQKCVADHAECGASMFERLPDLSDASQWTFGVPQADLDVLRNVTASMAVVVVAAQETFEQTFMTPCEPKCAAGELCLDGTCVYRQFKRRFRAPVTETPPQWWDRFRKDRPNHPQRDHWNQGKSLYWW